MTIAAATIARNLAAIRARMAAACARSNRRADAVRLVAVTKSVSVAEIRVLMELGLCDFGESRPQQLAIRAAELPDSVRWHLIGPLQRNKARKTLPLVWMIHSVDSIRLLETLDRLAAEMALRPQVLFEVNVSGEATKQGFSPAELLASAKELGKFPNVDVRGLMTMAPESDDPEVSRPTFRGLRLLRDELANSLPDWTYFSELSMGMSGDFETAIEEGATLIRIGSLLFESETVS